SCTAGIASSTSVTLWRGQGVPVRAFGFGLLLARSMIGAPRVCCGNGPIMRFHRWARQFYGTAVGGEPVAELNAAPAVADASSASASPDDDPGARTARRVPSCILFNGSDNDPACGSPCPHTAAHGLDLVHECAPRRFCCQPR